MTEVWTVISQHHGTIKGVTVVYTTLDGIFSTLNKALNAAEKMTKVWEEIHEKSIPPIDWKWDIADTHRGRIYSCAERDVIVTHWEIDHFDPLVSLSHGEHQ